MFINSETILHADPNNSDDCNANVWSMERLDSIGMSCFRMRTADTITTLGMRIVLYPAFERKDIVTIDIYVPHGWLPRTLIVLIRKSVHDNNGVILVLKQFGSVDVSGQLRL